MNIMRQSACLVVNPITVDSYDFPFNCTTVGHDGHDVKLIRWLVPDACLSLAGSTVAQLEALSICES